MRKGKDVAPRQPRVFVGSSTSNLPIARGLDHYLRDICLLTIWDQHVVRPSRFAFDELALEAERADFAIFVVGYDERRAGGSSPPFLVNQNVCLEIGLFAGLLGRERVYLLVPDDFSKRIQIPSDLSGLTLLTYSARRMSSDGNVRAAIATAGTELRSVLTGGGSNHAQFTRHVTSLFPDWTSSFQGDLNKTSHLSVCFVHSRRWRENHGDVIRSRSSTGDLSCSFLVPDLDDTSLVRQLTTRFDDGPTIPAMLYDLFSWLLNLVQESPQTRVHLLRRLPTYSYYRFDSHAYIALYPNAARRQASPTILVGDNSPSWRFLVADEKTLMEENPPVGVEELRIKLKSYREQWLREG